MDETRADDEDLTAGHEVANHPPSVIAKVHLLLEAVGSQQTSVGLSELSRRSGVSKASAYRLASELVRLGLLARTADGYQLGWMIFELGRQVPWPGAVQRFARPALLDLRAATRAVVHMAVRHGDECVLVERFAGRREMSVLMAVGDHVPLWRAASGRVFLAFDPAGPERAAAGAADPIAAEAALRQIRARGWAEESHAAPGHRTYAVPIFHGAPDRVVAAISATISLERTDGMDVLGALRAVGGTITRAAGRTRMGHPADATPTDLYDMSPRSYVYD